MRNPSSLLGTVVIALLVSVLAAAEVRGQTLDDALALAKRKKKLVLASFTGTDWSEWCIKLRSEVYETPEFKEWALKRFILLAVHYPKHTPQDEETRKRNRELASKYGIKGFPTVLFLDGDGKEIGRVGYVKGGPDEWIRTAEALLPKLEVESAPPPRSEPSPRSDPPGSGRGACSSCRATVPAGARFCPECGAPAPASAPTCEACGEKVSREARFCPSCGKPRSNGDRRTAAPDEPKVAAKAELAVTVDYPLMIKGTFFPALYHLCGQQINRNRTSFPRVTVSNRGTAPARALRVEVQLQEFSEAAVETVDIAPGGRAVLDVTPTIKDAIASVDEERPGAVRIAVKDSEGHTLHEQTDSIAIASKNDFLLVDSETHGSLSALFAVFVTPHDRRIDELVSYAAD
jgi:protein disulfide-isomerase